MSRAGRWCLCGLAFLLLTPAARAAAPSFSTQYGSVAGKYQWSIVYDTIAGSVLSGDGSPFLPGTQTGERTYRVHVPEDQLLPVLLSVEVHSSEAGRKLVTGWTADLRLPA